jgi:hypothetical protein
MKRQRQVSVRGVVYSRLKAAALARGVSVSKLVEAAIGGEPLTLHLGRDNLGTVRGSPAAPPGEHPHEQDREVSQTTRRRAEA